MNINERIYKMTFASVYPAYVAKVERKGQTRAQLDQVISWLTGYDAAGMQDQIERKTTFQDFFASAPAMNPARSLITGTICGVKLHEIKDPLMLEIRYLDKLVDEIAKGRPMEKVLRA